MYIQDPGKGKIDVGKKTLLLADLRRGQLQFISTSKLTRNRNLHSFHVLFFVL